MYAFVFNEQIFLLSPLTFLYSLSITYFSPRLYLSVVENRAHLRIFTEPTRHKALTLEKMKRAGWFGWWCQGTNSGDPEVSLKIFLFPGLFNTVIHHIVFSIKAL